MQMCRAEEKEYELTSQVLQTNLIQAETAFTHEIRKCSKGYLQCIVILLK